MTTSKLSDVRIITISRQFGSGGSDLGAALGIKLGWRVVDRDVVAEAARRLNQPVAEVEAVNEHGQDQWRAAASFIADAFPEMLLPPMPRPPVSSRQVAKVIERILLEIADGERCIIIGHGGQSIFRNRPDAFHVRVYAPHAHRITAVQERLGVDETEAGVVIRTSDAERALYLQQVYGCDWESPEYYALFVNTAVVPPDSAATMIGSLIEQSKRT